MHTMLFRLLFREMIESLASIFFFFVKTFSRCCTRFSLVAIFHYSNLFGGSLTLLKRSYLCRGKIRKLHKEIKGLERLCAHV